MALQVSGAAVGAVAAYFFFSSIRGSVDFPACNDISFFGERHASTHRPQAHKRVSMDSYPAHKLLTGREITRHRLRGLQASKELQRLNRRTSEGLMSTESLSSILQKFDLNGDGDDRKMAKEFVSALRSLNAAPAAGQRSMSALSSPDIRSIIQTISSPEKRPGHAPDAKSPDAKSKGAVDYHRLSRCRSYGDASDGVQVPKS